MPPTARTAPRGERRRLLVLTAGPVGALSRAQPTSLLFRRHRDDARGFSPLFFPAAPIEGWEGPNTNDAEGAELGAAQGRRASSRARVAAGLTRGRRSTTPQYAASGEHPDQNTPTRSARPPLCLPNTVARLETLANKRFRANRGKRTLEPTCDDGTTAWSGPSRRRESFLAR
jgi:hypothetical protein